MDNLRAVLLAEGVEPAASRDEYFAAWQRLVDTGLAWQLQGWFGRSAAALIEAGYVRPAGELRRRVTTVLGCGNSVRARTR